MPDNTKMSCSKLVLALVAMLVVGSAQAAERESALTGTCFTNVQDIGNSTDLDGVRGSVVVYNKMKRCVARGASGTSGATATASSSSSSRSSSRSGRSVAPSATSTASP